MEYTQLIKDCAFLSSGTLATLTGVKNLERIDRIQNDFVTFVVEGDGLFDNWKEAWKAYRNKKGILPQ